MIDYFIQEIIGPYIASEHMDGIFFDDGMVICGDMTSFAKGGLVSKQGAAEFCEATLKAMEAVASALQKAGKNPIWSTAWYNQKNAPNIPFDVEAYFAMVKNTDSVVFWEFWGC